MATQIIDDFLLDLARADEHRSIDVSAASALTVQAFPDGGDATGVSAVVQVWTSLGFDGGEVVRAMAPAGTLDLASGVPLTISAVGRTRAFVSVTAAQSGRPMYRVLAGLDSAV
jgi:hypothetical protein